MEQYNDHVFCYKCSSELVFKKTIVDKYYNVMTGEPDYYHVLICPMRSFFRTSHAKVKYKKVGKFAQYFI